ncbi:pheromone-like peptide [Fomitiporia mediterranea MF3/22]|nr:pheromone-like peptide [Fomitiporia mediterranea MF3/22]EJD06024.1 pheromone-like peptide [Fomitiporia mediterranea MF3/22]
MDSFTDIRGLIVSLQNVPIQARESEASDVPRDEEWGTTSRTFCTIS